MRGSAKHHVTACAASYLAPHKSQQMACFNRNFTITAPSFIPTRFEVWIMQPCTLSLQLNILVWSVTTVRERFLSGEKTRMKAKRCKKKEEKLMRDAKRQAETKMDKETNSQRKDLTLLHLYSAASRYLGCFWLVDRQNAVWTFVFFHPRLTFLSCLFVCRVPTSSPW